MIKLTANELEYISIFSKMTHATVIDCLITEGRIIFIVSEGELGKAIGKEASHLREAKRIFSKQVEVVEKTENLDQFVKNIFSSIKINSSKSKTVTDEKGKEKTYISVLVDPAQRGIAIGRGGERIKAANQVLQRYFNAEVKVV